MRLYSFVCVCRCHAVELFTCHGNTKHKCPKLFTLSIKCVAFVCACRCPAFKLLTYYGNTKERAKKREGWSKPNAFHVCITSYTLVLSVGTVGMAW
jgi:hypothetical protein